jgi:hypothetical protein
MELLEKYFPLLNALEAESVTNQRKLSGIQLNIAKYLNMKYIQRPLSGSKRTCKKMVHEVPLRS